MLNIRRIARLRFLLLACLLPLGLASQSRPVVSAPVRDVRFEVVAGRAELAASVVEVIVRFQAEGRAPVLLSMPAWTPGSYEIANYARNLSEFAATQNGTPLRWDKLDPDTWRVVPAQAGSIEVRYRIRADELDVAASWATSDFAFLNGTNLFLAAEGRLETPATVVVRTEPQWRVVSGLTSADSTNQFLAADFHDLVDHPLFVGRFDLDSALVDEKWMRLATWPVGSVQGRRRAAYWDALSRSVEPLAAVFGEVPWPHYTVLQVATEDFQGMSALEHATSELALVGEAFLDEPFVLSVHAHELAHAWNVKRLRPADLFPYRYDAPQPTTWLWVSEGITDYYADLALLRSGLVDESGFLETTLGKIESVEARPPTALEDASLQAWLGMQDGTGDLYYDKGSLAGLALDILIRDASNNARSLDHVMRELYDRTFRRGRGFTHDDFWNAVARATRGRAFGDFERRYIDGREEFPWRDWLGRGGWRYVVETVSEPRLGARLSEHPRGARVTLIDPAGMGARADLRVGDVILTIGGRSTRDPEFGRFWREAWGARPGATMPMTVLRGEREVTLAAVVEVLSRTERRIEPDPSASSKAQRIRAGILTGSPAP